MTKKSTPKKKEMGFLRTMITKVSWVMKEDTLNLHSAALTFFALFSFLPMLLLTYILFDRWSKGVATEFLFTTQEAMGPKATNALIDISGQLRAGADHWIIYAIGIIVVLYAASRFMYFLQKSMNNIWRVPTTKRWVRTEIKHRLISAVSLIILAFLATVVVLQKAALITIQKKLGPDLTAIVYYIAITLAMYSIIAIIYKVVPDKKLEWEDVIIGAVCTTAAFWVGFFSLRIIIQRSLVDSVYGAISGVLLMLLWVYYFAQIIYIGAEITKVYATHYGSLKEQKSKLIKEKHELEDEDE